MLRTSESALAAKVGASVGTFMRLGAGSMIVKCARAICSGVGIIGSAIEFMEDHDEPSA
jgi:hypothetical protein